jgi:hypothetical protein
MKSALDGREDGNVLHIWSIDFPKLAVSSKCHYDTSKLPSHLLWKIIDARELSRKTKSEPARAIIFSVP